MSAFPSRQYRVLSIERRTLVTLVHAKSAGDAEKKAAKLWDKTRDESIEVTESDFEVIFVECSDA